MYENALINLVLRHLPQKQWNILSSLCAGLSLPTIGSPIRFSCLNFTLEEFRTDALPSEIHQKFISFCYPENLPNRLRQIECDRDLYWKHTSTFLVFSTNGDIAGCIQVVPRNNRTKLPVEFARVVNGDRSDFDIRTLVPQGDITEIYRCRRSFTLKKMEPFYVLMMLFKAVWAKTIQLGTAYSCISFDTEKRDLHHLYCAKLAFTDPGVTLTFGTDPTTWSFLVKDWIFHEEQYATLSRKQFYMQTWGRRGLKRRHLRLSRKPKYSPADTAVFCREDVIIADTFVAPEKTGRDAGVLKVNNRRNRAAGAPYKTKRKTA